MEREGHMPARVPTFNARARRPWALFALVIAFVITACSGGTGGGGSGVSIALEPAEPTVVLDGSAPVQVSVIRSPAATAGLSL